MTGSYRQILRSSSIIGGASVAAIAIGLGRNKAAAILLGPAGVGMIGLFQNVMLTAATIAGLGLATVGTRQIAEAEAEEGIQGVSKARFALRTATALLAVLGGFLFWLLRESIAAWALGDRTLSNTVGWLSIGVAMTVAAGSQGALLAGLRRIGDLARVSVLSGLMASALGIACLYAYGQAAVVFFVLTVPICSLVIGHAFISRLPGPRPKDVSAIDLVGRWSSLLRLGTSFMLAGVAATVAQLLVRSRVNQQLGTVALGHFEASWVISMTYISFVLKAMGTDYYPRLTAAIRDAQLVNRMVNEQTEVALVLAGPLFLIMLGFSPWLMTALYSPDFQEATNVLRWQVMGDILKVASWPLGFIILAAGEGRTFVTAESIAMLTFVTFSWLLLPVAGIEATGVAFLLMYVALLPLVYWLAWRKTGFRWTGIVASILLFLVVSCATTALIASASRLGGAIMGASLAAAFSIFGLAHLGGVAALPKPLEPIASRAKVIVLRCKGIVRNGR